MNEERILPNLLNSLSNQSFKNFELIVVDGNSQDKTRDVFNKFKSKFKSSILLISKMKNVSCQRNIGAQKARGAYLVFFDADVTIEKDYMIKLINKLKQNIDFAATRFMPDTEKVFDHLIIFITNLIIFLSNLFGKPLMNGTNLIFKRDIFVKLGGFDQEVVFAEDVELAQRCAKNGFRGRVFFSPFHCISFRRIERDGWLMQIKRLIIGYSHILSYGPIKEPLFDYRMGGYVDKN